MNRSTVQLFPVASQALQASTPPKPYSIPVYRISLVRDSHLVHSVRHVNSSKDARDVLTTYLGDTDREHFVVLMLDQKHKILGVHTVSTGSLTETMVHPREVFKILILHNVAAFIAGHNHPSGDPQPSREDRVLTQRLVDAGHLLGIAMLDHIIVGDGTTAYFSFADEGWYGRV